MAATSRETRLRHAGAIGVALSLAACSSPVAHLEIAVEGNGETSPPAGSHSFATGETVKVRASPGEGARFGGWSGVASGAANPVSVVADGEQRLVAHFVAGGGASSGAGSSSGGAGSSGAASSSGGGSSSGAAGSSGAGSSSGGAGSSGGGSSSGGATSSSGGGSRDVAPSAGCGKTPALRTGRQSIQSGGKTRTYMITIPERYDSSHPYWLVFGYHWNGGNANEVDGGGTCKYSSAHYGLRALSDQSTIPAIFVAPDGIGGGWGNGGNSDVIFTDDMIKAIGEGLCIDRRHIFAHGFSYGGGMAKALACQRPDVFRGVAVYSGAEFLSGGCDGGSTSPVAFFGAHSISDPVCGYGSGEAIRDRFVRNNGCTPQDPPKVTQNQLTHVCTTYQGCKAGFPVVWCVFNGGGHTPAAVDGSTGCCNCNGQWIPPEVWKFFTQL